MKTLLIRAAVALTTAVLGFGLFCSWANYGPDSASRHELLKLVNDSEAASAKKDIATLDRITTDDFTVSRVDGSVINKAEFQEIIRNSDFVVDSFEINNVHVDIKGDRATANGGLEMLAHLPGRDSISHSSNFTYSFKKQQGHWQISHIQRCSNFTH
jgi:ketosteroid isomerase-like protein